MRGYITGSILGVVALVTAGACSAPSTPCRDGAAGACNPCGAACATGATCVAGACVCPAGQVACGGACVALQTSAANCGACGAACDAHATCVSGACRPTCAAAQTLCGAACVDTATDAANCGACGAACGANMACTAGRCVWRGTNVQHVVLVVQENHTFDSYFGRYCTAPAGSAPACTSGRSCCEAAPVMDANGHAPDTLDDAFNYAKDHDHGYACEVCEIHGGAMDRFTGGGCANDFSVATGLVSDGCSSPQNFAVATDATLMHAYWTLADTYALADRYFQPLAGGTSGNDMYFAGARYEFTDNTVEPSARGAGCTLGVTDDASTHMSLPGRTTIADVLLAGGHGFRAYADGYDDAYAAAPGCPSPAGHCHEVLSLTRQSCLYDPSDVPFEYYPQFTDNRAYMRDLHDYFTDVAAGTLPAFSYVKYRTSENEHPNWSWISDGASNVSSVITAILASPTYRANTLVLLTWDEGGGFYDHVAPPHSVETYGREAGAGLAGTAIPYGTRVPFLAIGAFARHGYVSHVAMEHSSIVAFLEWNFLGPAAVGALHAVNANARDGVVHGLGSLLDPAAVGADAP